MEMSKKTTGLLGFVGGVCMVPLVEKEEEIREGIRKKKFDCRSSFNSSSLGIMTTSPVDYVMVVGFHHQLGPQVSPFSQTQPILHPVDSTSRHLGGLLLPRPSPQGCRAPHRGGRRVLLSAPGGVEVPALPGPPRSAPIPFFSLGKLLLTSPLDSRPRFPLNGPSRLFVEYSLNHVARWSSQGGQRLGLLHSASSKVFRGLPRRHWGLRGVLLPANEFR